MANRYELLLPDIAGSFRKGYDRATQQERERLADQELRAKLARENQLRQLAPQEYAASTPEQQQAYLSQAAALDPQAAASANERFAAGNARKETLKKNTAQLMMSLPAEARAAQYQKMIPTFRQAGMDAPDVYTPEMDQMMQAYAGGGPKPIEVSPGASLVQQKPGGGYEAAFTAPFAPAASRRTVEYRDAGDRLVPVYSDTGLPATGVDTIAKGTSPNNDPNNPNTQRTASTNLRKEFNANQAVKDYRSVLPIYQRASTAPDTRAGDLSVIYALGKMFDPGSVVREGELTLSQDSATWLQKMVASAQSQVTGSGRLSPDVRKQIMAALQGQVNALREPYQQVRSDYGSYAVGYGIDPNQVLGSDPSEAFDKGAAPAPNRSPQQPAAPAAVRINSPQELDRLPSGASFIAPDGSVRLKP